MNEEKDKNWSPEDRGAKPRKLSKDMIPAAFKNRYPLKLDPRRGNKLEIGQRPPWDITVGTQFRVLSHVPQDGMGRPFHKPGSVWEVITMKRDHDANVIIHLGCKTEDLLQSFTINIAEMKHYDYLERLN